MGGTTASGFVIGRGTVSDLSQESSHEGLLLLRLWACGQGGRVVQAKRHVHSPRVENAARPWFGRDVHVHAAITKSDGVYFRCTLNGADGARWQEAPALAHAYEQGCRGLREQRPAWLGPEPDLQPPPVAGSARPALDPDWLSVGPAPPGDRVWRLLPTLPKPRTRPSRRE